MAAEEWRLVPGMSAMQALRARPGALAVFETLDLDPWLDPGAPLEALLAVRGLSWTAFSAAVAALPDFRARRDWDQAGIPELLDHLVGQHRDILDQRLPALDAMLRSDGNAASPPLGAADGALRALQLEWPAFMEWLTAHIREEEEFLFPRLLRYAWDARRGNAHPDMSGGSVNVYISIRQLGNEHRKVGFLRRWIEKSSEDTRKNTGIADGAPSLAAQLAGFQELLENHRRLEEEVLYPKARNLERRLYDLAIGGESRRKSAASAPATPSSSAPF